MKNTDKWTIGLGVIGVAIAFMTLQATQKEGGTGGSGGLDIPFINPQGGAVSGLAPEIAPETVASFFDTSKKASYVAPAITEQSFPGQLGWSGISEYMTGSKASSYAPVTPTTTSGGSGWSTVSSYTSGSSGSSSSSSKKASSQTTGGAAGGATISSVTRSISSGIKRGL